MERFPVFSLALFFRRALMSFSRVVLVASAILLSASLSPADPAAVVDVALDAVTDPDPHIRITFGYTLTDVDGDECAVELQYSFDGVTWLDTGEFNSVPVGGPPVSSPEGSHNEWYWNTIEEPAPLRNSDIPIWVKVRAEDDDGFDEDIIGPFTVYNQPRAYFTDTQVWSTIMLHDQHLMTDPPILERGEEFSVSGTLNIRNFTVGWGQDSLGPVDFDIYLNGDRICQFSDRLGPQLSPDDFSRPFSIYTQEELAPPIAVPVDFPVAPSYTLSIEGEAYHIALDTFSTPVDLAPARYVTLTSPNGLEEWRAGSTHNITWDTYYPRDSVHIYIYKAGVLVGGEVAEANAPYEWAIPATLTPDSDYSMRIVLPYDTDVFDWTDADFTILPPDLAGPLVLSPATVPTAVRETVDLSLSLTATADDSSAGESDIVEAEYFIGADPGAGNGTPMQADDGAFDSGVEAISATVDTSAWTAPGSRWIHVRARDASENWTTPVASVSVSVLDGTPPGAVTDLSVEASGQPALIAQTSWTTAGTTLPGLEEFVLDLSEEKTIGAVRLTVPQPAGLFPEDFEMEASADGLDWTTLARADSFRRTPGPHVWQVEIGEYRYLKITALSVLNRSDRHYYVVMPDVAVLGVMSRPTVTATWTAPADDGYGAASGPASDYDLRYSASSITPGDFDSCPTIDALPAPGVPGSQDGGVFPVDASGRVYFAIKTSDEVPNWSDLSNVAEAEISAEGFETTAPPEGTLLDADAPCTFLFAIGAPIKPVFVEFSNTPGFIGKPLKAQDGHTYRTLRFPVNPRSTGWTPSSAQWKSIKKIVPAAGTLYWRLSGKSVSYGWIYSRTMTGNFNCGDITGLVVSPAHIADSQEAVWPDKGVLPAFSWTDNTNGMKYFLIDISKDPSIPLTDRKSTIVLGGRGVLGTSYTLKTVEWKRVRRLATWLKTPRDDSAAEGALYWRVRALAADRTLSCASAVKTLIVDRGAWTTNAPDTDPATTTPRFSWHHEGEGIAGCKLELSVDEDFTPGARYTLLLPARTVTDESYTLSAGELRRLQAFMAPKTYRPAVPALYWRVRGEDSDRQFVCYSDTHPTTWAP